MSIESTAVPTITDLELFRGFTAAEIEQVTRNSPCLTLNVGDKLFTAGEMDRAIFVLVRGSVRIELTDVAESDATLAELNAISVFGESNFFHNHPHQTNAICTSEVEVLRFDRATYENWLQMGDVLAYKLGANAAEILASRLDQTDRWVKSTLHKEETDHARKAWRDFRSHMTSRFSTRSRMGFTGGT